MAFLPVRHLADLRVAEPGAGRPHVAAGSGLELCGDHAYVAIDDDVHLGSFDATRPGSLALVRVLPGELPADHADRKRRKPDIEAVTSIRTGASRTGAYELLGVPSGSTEHRLIGFAIGLDRDGRLVGPPRSVDWSELVAALHPHVGEVNIEGAALAADRLVMLCRGTAGRNHVASLALAALDEELARGAVTARSLEQVVSCHVGDLDGIALGFTDAASVDGRVLVSASAEDTANAYDDGPVAGSVLGWLSDAGTQLLDTRRVGSRDKVEGVAVRSVVGSELVAWLVTDNDEPERASRLLEVRIPAARD